MALTMRRGGPRSGQNDWSGGCAWRHKTEFEREGEIAAGSRAIAGNTDGITEVEINLREYAGKNIPSCWEMRSSIMPKIDDLNITESILQLIVTNKPDIGANVYDF